MLKQEERMLEYLKQNGKITVLEAMLELGIGCPTKTISNLLRHGYDIGKHYKSSKNRFGEPVRYMVYTWEDARK